MGQSSFKIEYASATTQGRKTCIYQVTYSFNYSDLTMFKIYVCILQEKITSLIFSENIKYLSISIKTSVKYQTPEGVIGSLCNIVIIFERLNVF